MESEFSGKHTEKKINMHLSVTFGTTRIWNEKM